MNINWIGLWTLYKKEVRRFTKVYNQTLVTPVITALLFLAIFTLAVGTQRKEIVGIPFAEFMVPGLIMMTIVQNAFANSSSSLIMGKVLGFIIDYLIPPISPKEMVFSITMGAVTRGIASGLCVTIAISFFVQINIHDIALVFFYAFFASSMLALFGILGAIFADSFDQMAAVTSYVITPLAFLSGTFYSVKNLPEFWQQINAFNPFFYMIDGFRYAITGYNDASLATGMVVLITMNILLYCSTQFLISKGYRIKN